MVAPILSFSFFFTASVSASAVMELPASVFIPSWSSSRTTALFSANAAWYKALHPSWSSLECRPRFQVKAAPFPYARKRMPVSALSSAKSIIHRSTRILHRACVFHNIWILQTTPLGKHETQYFYMTTLRGPQRKRYWSLFLLRIFGTHIL